jgi:uncharacterized protein (TIGR02246 family)
MRRPILAALLTIGLIAPAFAQQDLRQAADAIGQQYDQNYNSKNAAGMAALYTNDATFVPPGAVVQGREALEKYYQGRFATGAGGHVTKITEVQPMGDGGYGVGQFAVSVPTPNGGRRELHGNLVVIYKHESGGWKIRLLTANIIPTP